MIALLDTFTTKDKVLSVLCEDARRPWPMKLVSLKKRFPKLSEDDIIGIVWHLHRERFVNIIENGNLIYSVEVHRSATSYLLTKKENKYLLMKWDIYKILLGFALGFATDRLLQ